MIPRVRIVSGLAVNSDHHVLMGLRKTTVKQPSMWEYPFGVVERAEGDAIALTRGFTDLGVHIKVGRRLARTTLELAEPCAASLYVVKFEGQPKTIDYAELRWVDPTHAIEWLPCTPIIYQFHPFVRTFLRSIVRTAG